MAVKRSQAGSTAPPDGSRIAIASAASHDSRGERESPKGQQHEDDDDRGPVADPITKGGPLCFEARDGPRAAASVPAPPRGAPPLRCRRVRRRRSLALAGSRAAAPGAGIRSRGRSLDFQDVLAKPAVKGIRRSAQASAVVPVRSIVPSAIIDRRSSTTPQRVSARTCHELDKARARRPPQLGPHQSHHLSAAERLETDDRRSGLNTVVKELAELQRSGGRTQTSRRAAAAPA
jgi:hypothetical protein